MRAVTDGTILLSTSCYLLTYLLTYLLVLTYTAYLVEELGSHESSGAIGMGRRVDLVRGRARVRVRGRVRG